MIFGQFLIVKTKEEYEEEKRAERAMLEKKVNEADGISQKKAVEIAQKAMSVFIRITIGQVDGGVMQDGVW